MKKVVILTMCVFCIAISSKADTKNLRGLTTKSASLVSDSTYIHLNLNLDIEKLKLDSHYRLRVYPFIYNENGYKQLFKFTITGIAKSFMDRRDSIFRNMSISEFDNSSNYIVGKQNNITYRYSLKQESWMDTLSLRFDYVLEDCCGTSTLESFRLLNKVVPTKSTSVLEYKHNIPVFNTTFSIARIGLDTILQLAKPINRLIDCDMTINTLHDYELTLDRIESGNRIDTIGIYFESGKATFRKSFKNNSGSIKYILNLIRNLNTNGHGMINKISIIGMTPFGSGVSDDLIARKRMEVLREYIVSKEKGALMYIGLEFQGVDWISLANEVAKSNLSNKDSLLKIIQLDEVNSVKTDLIKELDYGNTYSYLRANVLPLVDNVSKIVIYYRSNEDAVGDKIRKAIDLIFDRRLDDAIAVLHEVEGDKRSLNPLGIAYQLKGNLARAQYYLELGARTGSKEAKENLRKLLKVLN